MKASERLLVGEKVFLRGLEAGDLEFLYRWENDPEVWGYGDCGVGVAPVPDVSSDILPGVSVPVVPVVPVALVAKERFSHEELREFIENQQHDIHVTQQQRFVICCCDPKSVGAVAVSGSGLDLGSVSGSGSDLGSGADLILNAGAGFDLSSPSCPGSGSIPVGFIDLFDYDPLYLRAGVGILVCDPAHRRKGYGGEALRLVAEYAWRVLGLRELWCNVAADNRASIALFSAAGFVGKGYNDIDDGTRGRIGGSGCNGGNGGGTCGGENNGNKKLLTFVKSSAPIFPPPV